jgi:hypothetical protein
MTAMAKPYTNKIMSTQKLKLPKLFVNLPIRRKSDFFGFKFNAQFTDDDAA